MKAFDGNDFFHWLFQCRTINGIKKVRERSLKFPNGVIKLNFLVYSHREPNPNRVREELFSYCKENGFDWQNISLNTNLDENNQVMLSVWIKKEL